VAEIEVRLIPLARHDEIRGERDGRLVIGLTAPPSMAPRTRRCAA
jgi:hypothetical protein